jgi:hypothetical protein
MTCRSRLASRISVWATVSAALAMFPVAHRPADLESLGIRQRQAEQRSQGALGIVVRLLGLQEREFHAVQLDLDVIDVAAARGPRPAIASMARFCSPRLLRPARSRRIVSRAASSRTDRRDGPGPRRRTPRSRARIIEPFAGTLGRLRHGRRSNQGHADRFLSVADSAADPATQTGAGGWVAVLRSHFADARKPCGQPPFFERCGVASGTSDFCQPAPRIGCAVDPEAANEPTVYTD